MSEADSPLLEVRGLVKDYPGVRALASAISLAKLIGERKGLSELVEPEVPSRVELPATTVTKDNVASVQNLGY